MLDSLTSKPPKRRQTCDPCRKAKIKCDKRVSTCGRCLATGDICSYGVSRQGAWWRQKDRKRSVPRPDSIEIDLDGIELPQSIGPLDIPVEYSNERPRVLSNLSSSSNSRGDSEQNCELEPGSIGMESNLNYEDLHMPFHSTSAPGESSYNGLPLNTCNFPLIYQGDGNWSSGWSDNGSNGLGGGGDFDDLLKAELQVCNPLSAANNLHKKQRSSNLDLSPPTCPCYAMVLQALQALEEGYLEMNQMGTESSAAGITITLQNNERTMNCCLTVLQCQTCRKDHVRSPLGLLFTLIRKEVLLMEEWMYSKQDNVLNHTTSGLSPIHAGDAHVKIEVAQVGTRRLREILIELRKAGQSMNCDFTRLAYTFLIESLMAQLKNASERLNRHGAVEGSSAGKTPDGDATREHISGRYQY